MPIRNKKEKRTYNCRASESHHAKYTYMHGPFVNPCTALQKEGRERGTVAVGAHHQPTLFAYTHILLPILVYRMVQHLFAL
jgi:hypothetical protein